MAGDQAQRVQLRPYPSLINGLSGSAVDSDEVYHSPVSKALYKLARLLHNILIITVRLVSRLLCLRKPEHTALQLEMTLVTAFLYSASLAASLAQHLRSLAAGRASHKTSAHLLRQTEAASALQDNWTEIAHSSSMQCKTIAVLQAAAFLQYFLVSVFEPAFGYVLVALLAEVMRRRLTYMLESRRAGKLTAWQDVEAPAQAITYWSLQESAKLEDVLAAMQEDVSYIRLVNIALTRPDQQEELHRLLAPVKQGPVAAPQPQMLPPPLSPPPEPTLSRVDRQVGWPVAKSVDALFDQHWKQRTPPPRSGNLSQLPARFQQAAQRGHEAAGAANGRAAASSASTSTQHLEHTPQKSSASRPHGAAESGERRGVRRRSGQPSLTGDGRANGGSHEEDDAVSVAGSTMSTHSRGEVKEASEVLADMESLWVAK